MLIIFLSFEATCKYLDLICFYTKVVKILFLASSNCIFQIITGYLEIKHRNRNSKNMFMPKFTLLIPQIFKLSIR